VIMMSGHSDASSGPIPEGGTFIAKQYLLDHLAPILKRLLSTLASGTGGATRGHHRFRSRCVQDLPRPAMT
jgi:hypothetical protein